MRILSFDIGIRNLAYCMIETSLTPSFNFEIIDWGIWDLRMDVGDICK